MRGKERQHKAEERRGRPLNQLLKEVCGKMSQAMQRRKRKSWRVASSGDGAGGEASGCGCTQACHWQGGGVDQPGSDYCLQRHMQRHHGAPP